MPPSSEPSPWWKSTGPLLALLVHAVYFLVLCPLHFSTEEWGRIRDRVRDVSSTSQWTSSIMQERGYWGLVIWYFDIHEEVDLYHRYAQLALRGVDVTQPAAAPAQGRLAPYRDVPVEYQPGALLFLLPPALFASSGDGYLHGFVIWCFVLYLAALLAGMHAAGGGPPTAAEAGRTLWWSVRFLFYFGGIVSARFDHAVAAVCVAGLWLFGRALRRPEAPGAFAAFGALAAAGVMVKIVPGVLIPAGVLCLLCGERRWRAALAVLGGFAVTLTVLHAAFAACWGQGYLQSYTYHMARGIQMESTYAGILMALHGAGHPLAVVKSFGSYNLMTSHARWLLPLAPVLLLALAGAVAWRFWRRKDARETSASPFALLMLTITLLLGFVLTNKVFSPQYLLWLAPLFAVACGRSEALEWPGLLFLLAAGLTQVMFPHLYRLVEAMDPLMIVVLNLRNLTLAVAFAWLLWKLPRILREGLGR